MWNKCPSELKYSLKQAWCEVMSSYEWVFIMTSWGASDLSDTALHQVWHTLQLICNLEGFILLSASLKKKNFQRLYHIRLLIYKITTQSLWLHNRSKPSRPMFELIKKVTGQLLSNIISYTHHCWFLLTFKGLASVHFRLWHHLRLFQPWVQQSLNYTNKSAFCASRLIFSYLSLQALSKPRVNHFWNLCSLSFIFISDCCCFWSSRWFLNESRWPLHKYS